MHVMLLRVRVREGSTLSGQHALLAAFRPKCVGPPGHSNRRIGYYIRRWPRGSAAFGDMSYGSHNL
jgi:hypothetical protein